MKDLMSFNDIGEELGISRQQAQKDYENGMRKIREKLEREPSLKEALLEELITGRD